MWLRRVHLSMPSCCLLCHHLRPLMCNAHASYDSALTDTRKVTLKELHKTSSSTLQNFTATLSTPHPWDAGRKPSPTHGCYQQLYQHNNSSVITIPTAAAATTVQYQHTAQRASRQIWSISTTTLSSKVSKNSYSQYSSFVSD
jgi:hypothetical protein